MGSTTNRHATTKSTVSGSPEDVLMTECDVMESELGAWLLKAAQRLSERRSHAAADNIARPFSPSLWRALVLIWVTSPTTRPNHSDEARHGLVAALKSMDDPTLMVFLKDWLTPMHSGTRDASKAA